jgi:ATP-dependent phosphofructokinase / diphosphate-dependent phosphofructokinase
MKKIAIMTAGGDCAGLNSVIKTVVLSAREKGITVVGILDGYIGFVEGRYMVLTPKIVDNIDTMGGTILGSSNKENPFHYPNKEGLATFEDRVEDGINSLRDLEVEGLIVIGGDGSLDSARVIFERGMPTIGIPKTIDNDMGASNPTIGFETAVQNSVDCISKLKTTAYSHKRVMVVELMGRTSGYLTLYAGFAAYSDIILLPEKDYDLDGVINEVKRVVNNGKRYCIIAMSEAAKENGKEATIARVVKNSFESKRFGGVSAKLAEDIEAATGFEARSTILGYLQRGGAPLATDMILGARLGNYALDLLVSNEVGYIVGSEAGNLVKTKFPKTREARLLEFENNDIIKTAKSMGIYFGE